MSNICIWEAADAPIGKAQKPLVKKAKTAIMLRYAILFENFINNHTILYFLNHIKADGIEMIKKLARYYAINH